VKRQSKTTITVNGRVYQATGSVCINNGNVLVNGKKITSNEDEKVINITIQGDIDSLDIDFCSEIKIDGAVGSLKTTSGDVYVSGGVKKGIKTSSGDVEVEGNVGEDVETSSGDVRAKKIDGKVKTMSGDIIRR